MNVSQILDAYLLERAPDLADKTLRGYRDSQRRLVEWRGDTPATDVTRPEVREWLKGRDAPVSANRDLALLRAAYAHAIDCGWCEHNPATVRRRTERPRRRVATAGEVEAISRAATPLWRSLVAVALLTGARVGELRMLKRSDVEDDGLRIWRTKVQTESLVLWTPALREAVESAKAAASSVYLFPSPDGGPYTAEAASKEWARIRRRAGVEGLQLRDLRRTAATDADDLELASRLLGHSSAAMTARVYRVRDRVLPVR